MHRIDGAGATADNKFTEGDASTGVAATVVTDDWLNATQEEIAHVIEQTGGTLNKADNTQLWTRLSAWFAKAQTATETLLGQLRIGTQAEVEAGTLDDVAVTPKKLRGAMLGGAQTWQNMSSARALNTIYTNTTGRPIMVNIALSATEDLSSSWIEVDGVRVADSNDVGSGRDWTQSAIVPAGSTYKAGGSIAAQIFIWAELR